MMVAPPRVAPTSRDVSARGTFYPAVSKLRHVVRTANASPILRATPGLVAVVFLAAELCGVASAQSANSDDPVADSIASDLVDQLRAAGYYDTAIDFLAAATTDPTLSDQFRRTIDMRRGDVYLDLASASRVPSEISENLANSQQALERFVAAGDHPMRREAQLDLGRIQMIRAAQLMTGDVDADKRKQAREAYLSAGKTFSDIVEDLRAELLKIRGAKIDPRKDKKLADQRDQMKAEFLQALINTAEAKKLAAETFPDPANGGKALLEESLAAFKELSEKYDDYAAGVTADVFIGEINEKLGNRDDAVAAFTRMTEAVDADPLRGAKYRAAAGLSRLYAQAAGGKPPVEADIQTAIKTAEPLIKALRPNERGSADANAMRLELARAHIARSNIDGIKPADKRKSVTEAKKLLSTISQIPGPHNDDAKTLLADLGVDVSDDAAITAADRPESTGDAVAKAQTLIQATQQMQQQIDAADGEEKTSLEKQLADTRGLIVDLLRQGLAMVNRETDATTADTARELIAYTLFYDGRMHDAYATGEFLSRVSPGTDKGLSGATIAFASLGQLILNDSSNDGLIGQLESFTRHMSATWPDDATTAKAAGMLVIVAINNGRFEEAERLIESMPDGPTKSQRYQTLGRNMYAKSVNTKDDPKAAEAARQSAQTYLQRGLGSIDGALVNLDTLKAALTLAKIQVKSGDTAAALTTLDHPTYGPATKIESLDIKDESFLGDHYSTLLGVLVGQMSVAEDSNALLDRASETLEKLQTSIKGEKAGARIASLLRRSADEIQTQIETAPPAKRQPLIAALRVLLERMAETTQSNSTRLWIGQTMSNLAESTVPPGGNKVSPDSVPLLKTAIKTFKDAQQAGETSEALLYQIGRAQRLSGDYAAAINTLDQLLQKTPNMIDAQTEAALAYEQWAGTLPANIKPKAYYSAISGGRPAGPKKTNTIWGWGKISKRVQRAPQYRETFFDARYHIALCRYLQAKADRRDETMKQAKRDITQIQTLYPDMGGQPSKQRFDKLLAQIEKEL